MEEKRGNQLLVLIENSEFFLSELPIPYFLFCLQVTVKIRFSILTCKNCHCSLFSVSYEKSVETLEANFESYIHYHFELLLAIVTEFFFYLKLLIHPLKV